MTATAPVDDGDDVQERHDAKGPGLRDALFAAALFVVAAGVFTVTSTGIFEIRDDGHILELSRLLFDGEIPHRDTNDVYGPGVFAVTGAALEAGGDRIMAVRFVLAATRAGAVAMAYLAARFVAPWPFALVAGLASLAYWGRVSWNLNVPYASVYTIPICLLANLLLLRALGNDRRRAYFATGLVAGLAILFKQTLGLLNVYVLAVALWAAAVLRDQRTDVGRPQLWLTTAGAAVVAAAASLVPFLQYLGWKDYLIHFAPMHALLAVVAAAGLRRGEAPDLRHLLGRVAPAFTAGVIVVPAIVAAAYAYWGSLDRLFFNMFVLPTQYRDYYSAVALPPRALSYAVVAVAAACTAGMLAASGRRLAALGAFAAAAPAALGAWSRAASGGFPAEFWPKALDMFAGAHLVALGSAAVVAIAAVLWRRAGGDRAARTQAAVLVALVVFEQSFAFTIFPSAGYNVFLIQGAITPLLAWVLWRWHDAVVPAGASRPRRAAAFCLVLVMPVWMTASIVRSTTTEIVSPPERVPIELNVAEGLSLTPQMHAAFHVTELEQLVGWLRRETTPETRLVLFTNEDMILFASERSHALPEYHFYLFITGWGLMHGATAVPEGTPPAADLLAKHSADVIVVERDDQSTANVRLHFPELAAWVDARCTLLPPVGGYRLRRCRPADTGALSRLVPAPQESRASTTGRLHVRGDRPVAVVTAAS